MTQNLKHKIYDRTVSEWIASVPVELEIDAVGMWQIVPDGREGFGLDGDELIEYVRRNIHALLDAGAVPVIGVRSDIYDWMYQPQYGRSREEITENVIKEWQASSEDPHAGGLWFARPGDTAVDMDSAALKSG